MQNFLLSQAERLGASYVFFDKDRGAEIFVRAAGGTYLTFRNGAPTGCAPLKALELTPANLSFLGELIRKLVTPDDRPLTVIEEERIDSGLRALGQLRQAERSFGTLRAFLGQQDREGIGARLERWCRGAPFGWVLDGDHDAIGLDARFIGFDMTDLLDHPTVRTPLMMYLFHRVERLIDGRRLIIDIDEFWKALGDEAFRDLANNKLKTIRKQNGVMVFGTQSPRDALASPIAHTIVEQCPTQIFLPNARGTRSDYVDGFHLTDTEFRLIKEELAPESRRFLVKQGHNSVVAELDLGGFDDALAVLSGRTETVELLDGIRSKSATIRRNGCRCFTRSGGKPDDDSAYAGGSHLPVSRDPPDGLTCGAEIVFDPSVFARQFEQLTELKKQVDTLTSQLKVAQDQLNQAKQLYDSFNKRTNANDIGALLNTPQFRKVLPQQFSDIEKLVAGQGSGNFANSINQYLNQNRAYAGNSGNSYYQSELDRIARQTGAKHSMGQAVYDTASQRIDALEELRARISSATDAKEVLDLSARLQAEQALLQNDVLRMQGLAMIQQARVDMDGQREREKQRQLVDEIKAALQ